MNINKIKAEKLLSDIHAIAYGSKLIHSTHGYDLFELAQSHYSAIGDNEELDLEILKFLRQAKASLNALAKLQELVVVG